MNNYQISILFLPTGKSDPDETTRRALRGQTMFNQLEIIEGSREDPAIQYDAFVRYAQGRYVTVVNGGDTFAKRYFANVLRSLEAYGDQISLVMTDKDYFFEGKKRKRVFLPEHLPKERTLINLWEREDAAIVPLFLNGTVIRTEIAKQYLMNPALGLEAEKEMLLRMSLEERTFLYDQSVTYTYHTPRDAHHYIFPGVYHREWYYESFSGFFLPFLQSVQKRYGCVPRYIQYVTAQHIVYRILANENTYNKRVVTEDGKTYLRSFGALLQYIGDDVLADAYHCPGYTGSIYIRLLLARLKYDDEALHLDYRRVNGADGTALLAGMLHEVPFFDTGQISMGIQFMEWRDGRLGMDLKCNSFFHTDRVTFYARLNGKSYDLTEEMRYSHCQFFAVTVYKYHTFHVSLPLTEKPGEQTITFWIEYDRQAYPLTINLDAHTSRIPDKSAYGYWRFSRSIVFCRGKRTIVIRPAKAMYTCYRELRTWLGWLRRKDPVARCFVALRILYFLTRPWFRKQRIWMFYDKIYKGGDSAEYLYKYCKKCADGIRTYYLLDPDASDYRRLKKEGYHPIRRNSLMHMLTFLNADIMVASNSTVFAMNGLTQDISGYVKDLVHFHVVCVQHGLSVQKIARAQHRLKDNTRLYFCASRYEIANLSRPIYGYAGYDVLRLTGVPRYDGLVDEAKKQILISPTWRMQSAMIVMNNEGVERDYNPYFKQTDYYRIYNSLINDRRLIETAKQYGYRIAYVLHPIVSPQAKDFDRNDYVDIIPSVGDMSYEKLFRESSLMVTDYSGVQFDFAYMRKPLVYLHHKDIPKHYEEGVFTYDTMAFGEICTTNEELVDTLIAYMQTGCRMKEKYVKRADDFFAFHDHKNCERIYKELIRYQYKVVDQIK